MRNLFQRSTGSALLVLSLLAASFAFAQTPQWAIAPADGNGHSIRAAFSPAHNAHHVAALDASGNLFIAGHYYLNPGNPLPEGTGQFLGKYDSGSGVKLWGYAGPVPSDFSAVALSGGGDAFVAGYLVTGGIRQHYVARISGATGDVMWEARGLPNDTSENYGVDLVLDASGNPVVLGGSNGRGRAVVTKYDANSGAVLWSVVPGPDVAASQTPFGIDRGPDGNIVGFLFDGESITNDAASFLFKLDGTSGTRIWGVPLAYARTQIVALTLDGSGKPILAGKEIAKYSNIDGSLIWARPLDASSTNSFAYDVAARSNGDIYAAGTEGTYASVPLLVLLSSLDGSEVFYSPASGVDQTTPGQYARSVAVDINDNAVVVERVFDTTANDYVIATRVISPSNFPMHTRYSPGAGAANGDADLALVRLTTPYVIGHFSRPADGSTYTVALKYGATAKVNSSMTLTASPNPAALGQPVSITATVSGRAGTPTGTVDVWDGGSPIAACQGVALSGGAATCNAGALSPGTHDLTASYSGDALYAGAGASTTERVQNNQATVNVASSANPVAFEQPVTFTASVSGNAGTPTGTVTFNDGSGVGSGIYGCTKVPLSGGSASCTLNGLMPGTHSISASYSGDGSYDPAASSALAETVQGSIAAPSQAWQVTTTSSPEPFLDKVGPPGTVGPRGGVDAVGDLFVIATTVSQPTPAQTTSCLVVVKYAASTGALAWRRDMCTPDLSTFGASLGVDGDGNVLVTGARNGLYIAKLSGATGAPVWERTVSGLQGFGIGLDSAGNARVVGWNPSTGAATVYAIANSDGSVQWQRILAPTGTTVMGFAVNAAGSVALYQYRINEATDTTDRFITRLDPAGNVAWTLTNVDSLGSLVLDAQGNVIGTNRTGLVKRDAATGSLLWQQSFGGLAQPDGQGNVFVAASVNTSNSGGGPYNAFFAKIDPSGNVAWSRLFQDGNASFLARALTLDTDGNLVAVASGGGRQSTYKVSSQDGHLLWIAQAGDLGSFQDPAGVFAVPQGVMTFGELIGSGGTDQGLYAALYSHDAAATGAGSLALSPTSVDFGGESMGTTSPPRSVIVTNTSSGTVNVTSVAVSGPFAQTNDCGALAAGAACTVNVTFSPPVSGGALNSTAPANGTLTVAHDGAGSPATATLAGTAEKSLVTHYYRSILRRAPDAGGHDFWQSEAARMAGLGANVNETWFAMAMAFFASPEYAGLARDDSGYLTDLYTTFFNRAPDADGFGYWSGQMAGGMPRESVMAHFLFSSEFAAFTQRIFGNAAVRPEIDMTMDMYRGLLHRLPDSEGFNFFLAQFRQAQCSGSGAVRNVADTTSLQFLDSDEYGNLHRTNAGYISDLYNAIMRRGPDLDGAKFWIGQLDSGTQTREQVRQQFVGSPEFSNRVANVIQAGCMQ